MGDRGRAQSRSRGRSKGKVATPSMSSLAAAAQSSISGTTPASAPQHQPIQEKLPPPQTMVFKTRITLPFYSNEFILIF